jgi:hypothetical protein
MKNTSDFKTDLDYGEAAEKMFDGYFKNGNFEFKRDRMMHRTGRVYIEYMSRGEVSGIGMTEVEPIWIYVTGDCGFGLVMDAARLREAIKIFRKECLQGLHEPPASYKKLGGDEDTSVGALIPVEDLARIMLSLAKPTDA